MKDLEKVILKTVRNLKSKGKLEDVSLSKSKKEQGIDLTQVDEGELKQYLENITNIAYLKGIGPAKDSWHQINGVLRPIVNAGIIELAKHIPYLPGFDKNHLYRATGIKIGKNTTIAPRVQFDYLNPELIEIGDNCIIGDGAKIWTHDYNIDSFMIGSVKIGDNVRIGSESVLFPCNIGNNVITNFGAFIYGEIPDNTKVFGRKKSKYELK